MIPIPSQNDPKMVDFTTEADAPRAFMPPHVAEELDGSRRIIYPALAVRTGELRVEGSEDMQPFIRLDGMGSSLSLQYLATAEELRTLGQSMIDGADAMEARANSMLADALAKRGNQS